ncbi:DUF3768 domain-containing protein [Falsirhodobacter sp. 1013]|uniref:DUF3768 domain-containing protein n=1 Tax=Falsirhodobacter sp. 1013 TaxID=3417566 RepID=UPI003EBE8ACD
MTMPAFDWQTIEPRARKIAEQNDRFRTTWGADFTIPGHVVVTAGVHALGFEVVALLMVEVMGFATFTEDNDPSGLHDFGVVTICGVRVYWKIDLYDPDYAYGSEVPDDPTVTRRVLTLLLPSEY